MSQQQSIEEEGILKGKKGKKKNNVDTQQPDVGIIPTLLANAEEEIQRLNTENQELVKTLESIEHQEKVHVETKTEVLRKLAANYERLHELGEYKQSVNYICTTICEDLRERGLWASESLAHKILDKKYLRTEYDPTKYGNREYYGSQSTTAWPQTLENIMPEPDSNNMYAYKITKDLENQQQEQQKHPMYDIDYPLLKQADNLPKPPKEVFKLSRDELRDFTEQTLKVEKKFTERQREIRRRRRELVAECIKKKVALAPELDKNRQTHISATSEKSGLSEAADAIDEHIEMWEKVKEALIKYQPDEEMAQKIAYYLRAENEFLKPWADQKYRKDSISWHIAELENVWYGKHASAKKTKTILEEAQLDENGVVLDKELFRCLTREQVGDKLESVIRQALMLQRAFKYKIEIHKWYLNYPEKRIGLRAHQLGPILSEKSFSGT